MITFINIIFILAMIIGSFFVLFFLFNLYDFYVNQKELHLRIIFNDKMNFLCAALILLYMLVNDVNFIGMGLFIVLLLTSFISNVVVFSRYNMIIFNNKFKYESIDNVTINFDKSSSKKLISLSFKDKKLILKYVLRIDDIDYIKNSLSTKNVNIKELVR